MTDVDNTEKVASTIDYEGLASEMGWTPKDKFKGDPERWVDAQAFYEKAEHVLPIVKKQRDEARKAQAESKAALDAVKGEVEQVKKEAKEAIKFMQDGLEREYKAKELALRAEKAEAISAGDGIKAMQVEEKLDALKEEKKEAKQEVKQEIELKTPQVHPQWDKWEKDNTWFTEDEELKTLAVTYSWLLAKKDPALEGSKLWDAAKAEIMKRYPEKFPDEAEERPGAQRGGKSANTGTSKAKTYANLPPDAKATCDKYLKNGYVKTKEQYCELYYAQE